MSGPGLVEGSRAGHVRGRVARRRPLPWDWRGSRVDLGHRHPAADRSIQASVRSPGSPLPRPRDHELGRDEVLVGVEHGDLGAARGRLSPELRAVVQATVLDGTSGTADPAA
jgi:hypothetical protein